MNRLGQIDTSVDISSAACWLAHRGQLWRFGGAWPLALLALYTPLYPSRGWNTTASEIEDI